MKAIALPYGRTVLSWAPAPDLRVTVADTEPPSALPDPMGAVRDSLDHPLDSQALEDLARGARRVTIVVTDSTRPCPDHLLVAGILERLGRAGVPDSAVTILVAIGMHRPSTPEEKREKLGEEILRRCRVVDSAPQDPALQLSLGPGPEGLSPSVDRRAAEADLLVATGIVEPHQYAGFSGGWKTVAIGTAGAETIGTLHGMRYLEDPGVRLANTEGNPFLEAARWIGERAGLRFVVNVALGPNGAPVAVLAGHPESVHRELARRVMGRSSVTVPAPAPVVIGACGHPKDSNLYQATRVPTYICFSRRPAIAPGGTIIVPAACPEGAGQGPGERLFLKWLSESGGPDRLIERARREGYPAGGQRAVMVAWALQRVRIAFVGVADPAVVTACGMEPFPDLPEAVAWAVARSGSPEVLVIPHALTTLVDAGPNLPS